MWDSQQPLGSIRTKANLTQDWSLHTATDEPGGLGVFSIMILQLPDSGFVSAPCLVFDPKEVLLFSLGERRLWGDLRTPASA